MTAAGITNMSAYIRKMCCDGYIVRMKTDELKEISRLLSITSNNVNQIARRVNSSGHTPQPDIEAIKSQLEEIFGKLSEVMQIYAGLMEKLR